MDYESLSDFEINKLVAIKSGKIKRSKTDKYFLNYGPDYCNSWADMGPIIERENISLLSPESCIPSWDATHKGILHVDKNPLRAAAIVYLMMGE